MTESIKGEEVEGIKKVGELVEVVVTGSRIRRDTLNEPTPVTELVRDDVVNTGI